MSALLLWHKENDNQNRYRCQRDSARTNVKTDERLFIGVIAPVWPLIASFLRSEITPDAVWYRKAGSFPTALRPLFVDRRGRLRDIVPAVQPCPR